MHTEVCIGLDIAHFPSLMYGFIVQQAYIIMHTNYKGIKYGASDKTITHNYT